MAGELRNTDTQASERPGLESRLKVLDERLIQIERDMAINSGELANAPARSQAQDGSSTSPASGGGFRGANPNLITVGGFLLLMPLALQFARRKFGPASARFDRQAQAEAAALRERIWGRSTTPPPWSRSLPTMRSC